MHKIVTENASIKIKNKYILKDINLEFENGKIYGFYGRNGSGKTVFMKSIIGLMKLTEGRVICDEKIIGKDMDFLPDAGILIEEPSFYRQYSAVTNLKMLAGIQKKITKTVIEEAIRAVGLDPDDSKKVSKYSLGMLKRLGIAQAIMEDPEILILDEATSALDEEGVNWFRNFMLEQKEKNKLVIISSHIKEDIEMLCDEVISLEHGKVTSVKNFVV